MEERKILIADPSEEFITALAEKLNRFGTVRTCTHGGSVQELIGSFHPDALVLDLALPDMDGLELVEKITKAPFCPAILVTTRFVSDYVIDVITRMGVSYVMYKPCDMEVLAKRVADILAHHKPALLMPVDPRSAVSNMLLSLGISTRRRGYMCLREGIIRYSTDPAQSITKELYPAVAKLIDNGGADVEHLMRTAITAAWLERNDEVWGLYFRPGPDGVIRRPTNGEFISRLAEALYLGDETEPYRRMCR